MSVGEESKAREMLLRAREESRRQISRIYECRLLTYDVLRECLTDFVLAKFLLTREEASGIDFQQLSELSLAKSMKISKDLVREYDMAKGCTGVSSVMVKKALLFMAVEQRLSIVLPPEQIPCIHCFDDLARLVWDAMKGSGLWELQSPGTLSV